MMIILLFILLILIALIITIIIILSTHTNSISIIGGKKKYTIQPKLTYKLFCNDTFCEYLRHRLNALGWKEMHNNVKYVDFAYRPYHKKLIDKNISKKFKYIHANLKSTLNNFDKLGDKQELSTIMKHSQYIAPTEKIKDYHWKDGDIIIIREIDSQKQKGIYILIDKHTFIELKNRLFTEKKNAIVSKYIINPLLHKGKKFHLRVYITIFIDKNGNKKINYMLDYIEIVTAKKKYIIKDKIDYLNPEMNISGGATTDELFIWGVDQYTYLSGVDKQITSLEFFNKCNKSIDAAINSIPLDSISLYPDQKAGFYTYGGDIMLDDTGHAWILELNMDPACIDLTWLVHKKFEKSFMDYLYKWYNFVLNNIILPYFGYI